MATTIADLLDALTEQATEHTPAADLGDADRAVHLLGQVLHRLLQDGLTPLGGSERERWVGEAARACTTTPIQSSTESRGRLTQLAEAVFDAVSLQRANLGSANRWALAIAILEPVGPLTTLAAHGDLPAVRLHALIVADAATTVIARSAALDPPGAQDGVSLDAAIPRLAVDLAAPTHVVVSEAIAGLEHATRPSAATLSVADYLAVCIAVETLCRNADSLANRDPNTTPPARTAGEGWAAARAVLNPFDDGSRRPQPDVPLVVHHALRLHNALSDAPVDQIQVAHTSSTGMPNAVVDAVQRVPTIATNLRTVLSDWATAGTLLAYARDLPARDSRVWQRFAGFTAAGLVRVDRDDLAPARAALTGAHLLSVDLAAQTSRRIEATKHVAHLVTANRDRRTDLTDSQINAAAAQARHTMQTHSGAPRGGRGPRR